MSASVARIGAMLRLGDVGSRLTVAAGVVGVMLVAAISTRLNLLPLALAGALAGTAIIVSVRWPIVALLAFAALIPIEEVALIGGFGTYSRLAGLVFAVAYALPRLGRVRLSVIPVAGWAYLVWAIVSLSWAIDAAVAWTELVTLIQLFVIAVLIADFVVDQPRIVRPVMWAYTVSAGVTAVLGILSYLTLGVADSRAAALQGQNVAQFAAVLIPAVIFSGYEAISGDRRVLAGLLALVTTLGIVVSGTRGAWVALAVVPLIVLPQLAPRRRIAAIVGVAAMVVVIYQVPGVADLVAERAGNALNTGGAGRTDIWSAALTIYQSAPVLGVGYANFPVAYTPEVVRAANISGPYSLVGYAPHNLVVGTVIELGPVGLILLAAFLGQLTLRRGYGREAAAIQASLISLLTLALFLDIVANRKQVWLIIGIAAGLLYLARGTRRALEDGDREVTSTDARSTVRNPWPGQKPAPGGG